MQARGEVENQAYAAGIQTWDDYFAAKPPKR